MDRFLVARQRADGSFPARTPGLLRRRQHDVRRRADRHDRPPARAARRPARRARWTAAVAGAARLPAPRRARRTGTPTATSTWATRWSSGWRRGSPGRADLRRAYEASWSFVLAPPGAKWRGYGLRYRTVPRRADGADGAGYLTEAGDGGVGLRRPLRAAPGRRRDAAVADPRRPPGAPARQPAQRDAAARGSTPRRGCWTRAPGRRNTGRRCPSRSSPRASPRGRAGAATTTTARCRPRCRRSTRWFDANLDPRSLYDNGSWAFYLGESAANFVLLPDRSACGVAPGATICCRHAAADPGRPAHVDRRRRAPLRAGHGAGAVGRRCCGRRRPAGRSACA